MPCYDPQENKTPPFDPHNNPTAELLCEAMQKATITNPAFFSSCSPGLQAWWQTHQRRDFLRVKRELAATADAAAYQAVLARLTPYERELLRSGGV